MEPANPYATGVLPVCKPAPIVEGGEGHQNPCKTCRGSGVQEMKTLSVKVPPGVDTDDRIRLSGEGESGVRGGPGNWRPVCSRVVVKEHPIFVRDGSNPVL